MQGRRRVHFQEAQAVAIEHPHGMRVGLEQQVEALLTLPEALFRALAGGALLRLP